MMRTIQKIFNTGKVLTICAGIAILTPLCSYAQNKEIAELPKLPITPLKDVEIATLTKNDSQSEWAEFAKKCKDKAIEFAKKDDVSQAASWLYTGCAAAIFGADEGYQIPAELKGIIIKDLPSFFDFYETLRKEDSLKGVCDALTTIYQTYPAAATKNLRSAYAVSLIYDELAPANWPECNVPSNPAQIRQAQESFNIFMENKADFSAPFDFMTVREQIFVFGVAGPIDELRSLKNNKISPSSVERLTQSIKTDVSRVKKNSPWDDEYQYIPENIRKLGGLPVDKVYYAWRTANANAIPCLYFSELVGAKTCAWLWIMVRPGVWKTDVARDVASKSLYGRPLDPQTWKNINLSELWLESKNRLTDENVRNSLVYMRLAQIAFEAGKYSDSVAFSEKSLKGNPENWKCYLIYISAKARGGADEAELDALWKKSYETFRKYPDICMDIVNNYRSNLIARRKAAEADKLFLTEIRAVMRQDTGVAIEMCSEQLNDYFARLEDKKDIFGIYQDILRNCSNCKSEAYKKIVVKLAGLFGAVDDYRSATKVISMFESSLKQENAALRVSAEKLKERYEPSKLKKEVFGD